MRRMQPVLTPTIGVDPRDALATSMFGAPGVYAILVGSGMSSAAGVLTGERIIEDLVRKVARSAGADPEVFDADPRSWWEQRTGALPRYDSLLEAVAGTDAARQALLRSYFERHPETGEPIEPTPAHHALAALCRAGFVRIVLTTNFDNLIERALEAAGVTAQVLSSEHAIEARIPLVHTAPTVVKLHGDYRTLGLRNTSLELGEYGPAQRALLREVFDDYGLVTVGWSAEWDLALTETLEALPSRRYPAYWASFRSELTDTARRLIDNRQACEITTEGAEELLPDLVARIDRLGDRARRRSAPTVLREYLFAPEDFIPEGWAALPLLVLRTTALATPVSPDSVGLLGPEQRDRITATLVQAPFHGLLAAWNSLEPSDASTTGYPRGVVTVQSVPGAAAQISSSVQNEAPPADPLVAWVPVPKVQSTEMARYRLGGDAALGVSTLVDIRLPQQGHGGVLFQLDIGISLAKPLSPWALAQILRDGLVFVSSSLPSTISDILPGGADVSRCDVHLVASQNDGRNGPRENNLDVRVDFAPFHLQPNLARPSVGRSLGFGARVAGALTQHQASELIVAGVNYMVLAAGFLDPRPAMAQLRGAVGLPPAVT